MFIAVRFLFGYYHVDYVSCMLLHRPSGGSYTPDIVYMYIQSSFCIYFCTGGWWTCERVDWNWEKELFLRGAYTFIHNIIHLCTVHVHCTCTCMCSVLELSVQDLNFNVVERSNYFLLSYGFHSPLITRTFAAVSMMLLMCWWQWTSFPRRKRRLSG